MAIRASLARLFGAKASIIGLEPDELPDKPLEKEWDDATLLSTFGDDAWPYVLANKVGEQASQAPIQIGRMIRGQRGKPPEFEPMGPDHPVQQLFDSPNELMDGGEFVHMLTLYMGLSGHCPIEFVKPAPGAVIGAPGRRGIRARNGFELQLINPGPWRIVANSRGQIIGYLWVRTSEEDIRWTPDQMTYLRWPNPRDRWYGQGHIQAVRQQVMAEEYAAIRDKRFEKQLGVPPGILSSEMPLGEPMAKELQKRWEQAVGGYRNAGKIAVLGSKTTYQAVQQSARDAEWLKVRHDRVEIMAAAFGIPLPLVRMQDATFSNVQDARAEFWEGTLQPRLNRIARMLTTRLIPLVTSEPLVARFDYTQIEALGENDLEAAQTAAQWTQTGAVTVNEVRKRLGLDPHADAAFGERLLVPSSLQIQDPAEIATSAALGIEGAQASIEATRNPPPQDEPPSGRPPARRRDDVPFGQYRKAERPDRAALTAPLVEGYRADLADFFRAQANTVLNARVWKAEPPPDSDLARAIIDILTLKKWRDRLVRISRAPIESSWTLGATEAARTLGVSVSYAIPASPEALEQVTQHLNALGVGIEHTTVEDVRRVITQSLAEGADNATVRSRLGELLRDNYTDWRADRISRTEVTAAYNRGSVGQYRSSGVAMVDVFDGDLDDPCARANGDRWTVDRADAEPISHPNCTRVFAPVFDEPAEAATLGDQSMRGTTRKAMQSLVELLREDAENEDRMTALMGQLAEQRAQPIHVDVAPPVVNVEPPVVHVAPPEAPNVTVDVRPFADALEGVRRELADIKAASKPRKRRLVRDELGRITGSEDVPE